MAVLRPRPVAVCTGCGSVSYTGKLIAQLCKRKINRRACGGEYVGALQPSDWLECGVCAGTGQAVAQICESCAGVGWRFVGAK
jgi:hypothetical protein